MEEQWRDVPGLENVFRISNQGKVFSKRSNRLLKTVIGKTGYEIISTRLNGRGSKAVCLKIHRLVAMAFIENPGSKPFVNHKDGDKLNNIVSNLEWATPKENTNHAYSTGLAKGYKGFDNKLSKLTKEEVEYIESNFGKISHRDLAKMFNVGKTTITNISLGLNYNSRVAQR